MDNNIIGERVLRSRKEVPKHTVVPAKKVSGSKKLSDKNGQGSKSVISAQKEAEFNDKVWANRQKRIDFLRKQTDVLKHFLDDKEFMAKIEENPGSDDTDSKESTFMQFESSPDYIKNGAMREYQVAGLNWLISLYENGVNGILADEMGLGKTIQTISFLGYIKHIKNQSGPHIVIVPKSTLQNWISEINKWCPSLRAVCFIGYKKERNHFKRNVLHSGEWDVCVTSYEMCLIEKFALSRLKWHCLVMDEAHRIKNEKTVLYGAIRRLKSISRILLTGTPVQNNLHELWALLNYMLPDVFNSSKSFDEWFNTNKCLKDKDLAQHLHSVLKPFMLRRVKSVVEKNLLPKKEIKVFVGLSKMQRDWYTRILLNGIGLANGNNVSYTKLLNVLMQLRKCTMHPYLFEGAEPGPPYTTDFHMVKNSGKMIALDKILLKLKDQGSRVLIFSQMTKMLNILEDYCTWRDFEYCRLDGDTEHEERDQLMKEYNNSNSKQFIFLLSTRAGGLGINLATADVVILYDSDFNPQMDLQAMDRAHRIGQKKQVRVFRVVTKNTVDEKMVERAEIKLRLSRQVIKPGATENFNPLNSEALLEMIRFGAKHVFNTKDSELTDEDIDLLLEGGETKPKSQQDALDKLDELSPLQSESESESAELLPMSIYHFEGEDYREKQKLSTSGEITGLPKRWNKNRIKPLPPNYTVVHDFQFFPHRLYELQKKKLNYYLKTINYNVRLDFKCNDHLSETELEEQRTINEAVPLTDAENIEMNSLLKEGFITWTEKNLKQFVTASAEYPKRNFNNIFNSVEGKTHDEVIRYANVFWQRYGEIQDINLIRRIISKNDLKKEMTNYILLSKKISLYRNPLEKMEIKYLTKEDKDKHFSEEEDRFIVCTMQKYGLDSENLYKLLDEACASENLPPDSYIKTCSISDLSKRYYKLMEIIGIEINEIQKLDTPETGMSRKDNNFNNILQNQSTEKNVPQKRKRTEDQVHNLSKKNRLK